MHDSGDDLGLGEFVGVDDDEAGGLFGGAVVAGVLQVALNDCALGFGEVGVGALTGAALAASFGGGGEEVAEGGVWGDAGAGIAAFDDDGGVWGGEAGDEVLLEGDEGGADVVVVGDVADAGLDGLGLDDGVGEPVAVDEEDGVFVEEKGEAGDFAGERGLVLEIDAPVHERVGDAAVVAAGKHGDTGEGRGDVEGDGALAAGGGAIDGEFGEGGVGMCGESVHVGLRERGRVGEERGEGCVGWEFATLVGVTMRVTNLTVAFDSRVVLRGVNAAFAEGTFTVVLGPNGVGKTTLLRAMVGVRGATSGDVELCGRPLGAYGGRERAARLAYVPQRSVVEFGFTVAEVVGLGRYGRGEGAEGSQDVEGAMKAVGMEALGGRVFSELSVGQQQRATVARALAQLGLGGAGGEARGKVLLADEPAASLDPAQGMGVLELLRGLADRGLCVVAVVHDLTVAMRYADRALVLNGEGGVEADESIGDVVGSRVLDRVYGVRLEAPGPGDVVLVPRRGPVADGRRG